MDLVSLSGQPVVDLRLILPRVGVWSADVSVDSTSELAGRVDLNVGGVTFSGVVRRGGVDSGVGVYRLVGGAGGLRLTASPCSYLQPSVNLVLTDLLGAAGESLSSTSDPSTLGTVLDSWQTFAMPTGLVVGGVLSRVSGATWRVLQDGSVWVGQEGWATSKAAPFVSVVDHRSASRSVRFEPGDIVLPGTTWDGRRVSHVEILVVQDNGGALDGEVFFE